jgi:hypothetical protein
MLTSLASIQLDDVDAPTPAGAVYAADQPVAQEEERSR